MRLSRIDATPGNGRVFIPSLPTKWDSTKEARVAVYDTNDAERFGTVLAISLDIESDKESTAKISNEIADIEESDFILAIGDIGRIMVAVDEARKHVSRVRLLQWDRRRRKYFCTEVSWEN